MRRRAACFSGTPERMFKGADDCDPSVHRALLGRLRTRRTARRLILWLEPDRKKGTRGQLEKRAERQGQGHKAAKSGMCHTKLAEPALSRSTYARQEKR